MGGPSLELASAIELLAVERELGVNVYEAPPAQLVAPAIVIRPDSPWMTVASDDQPFGRISERYAAVAVAQAGDPVSAKDLLRDLVRLARDAALGLRRWSWTDTSGIAAAEDSGVDYLASTVRVSYSADD